MASTSLSEQSRLATLTSLLFRHCDMWQFVAIVNHVLALKFDQLNESWMLTVHRPREVDSYAYLTGDYYLDVSCLTRGFESWMKLW
jgi:hypothetical protein